MSMFILYVCEPRLRVSTYETQWIIVDNLSICATTWLRQQPCVMTYGQTPDFQLEVYTDVNGQTRFRKPRVWLLFAKHRTVKVSSEIDAFCGVFSSFIDPAEVRERQRRSKRDLHETLPHTRARAEGELRSPIGSIARHFRMVMRRSSG